MRPLVPQVAGVAAALALCACFAQAQKQDPPPIGAIPIETVVEQLDRNGNGCVDLEEGRNYTSRRLHQMDTNKDEVLDAVEAPPGPGETTETRPISLADWQDAYTARFTSFDSDANGCLTRPEIEAGRAQGGT